MALLFALSAVGPAARGGEAGSETRETLELTGYFTDEWCGKSNANPAGAACARRCADKGSAMALFAGGKLYKVSDDDKQTAVDHVGVRVVVKAILRKDGTLAIESVKKVAPES